LNLFATEESFVMSDRERWIVYPLLFLSLGLTLKPKFTHELEVPHIHCRSITCGDEEAGSFLRLQSDRLGPIVNFYHPGPVNEQFPIFAYDSKRQPIQIGNVVIHHEPPPAAKTPPTTPSDANAKKPRPPEPPNGE
jgi:hypothetical protein